MTLRARMLADLTELDELDAAVRRKDEQLAQLVAVIQLKDDDLALQQGVIRELRARIEALEQKVPPVVVPEPPKTGPSRKPMVVGNVLDDYLLAFAETANRNWNFGGHSVAEPFDAEQGYWVYGKGAEPWLFDRPSMWFKLFELMGDPRYLEYAKRDLDSYAKHIGLDGHFVLKTGEKDTKYLYLAPFVLAKNHGIDITHYADVIERIWKASKAGYSATRVIASVTTPGGWTERESWVHGETALYYYLLTGNQEGLDRAKAIVTQYGTGVNLVTYTVHEGGLPGGAAEPNPPTSVSSPWMSALCFQFARAYYEVTGDAQVLQQAANYTDFLLQHGFFDGSKVHANQTGFLIPRYLTGSYTGGEAAYKESDKNHALDVLGFLHFGKWCKQQLGQSVESLEPVMTQLERTAVDVFRKWVRTTSTLPKYRLQAPRSFLWLMRGRNEFIGA